VADYVLEGPSIIRPIFIISDRPEQISQAIIERMGVGVTAFSVTGMFTHSEHAMLFCTVNRSEVKLLKSMVREADPRAFVVIAHGHQTAGGMLGPGWHGAESRPATPSGPAKADLMHSKKPE